MLMLRDHSGQNLPVWSSEGGDRFSIGRDSVQLKTGVCNVFDHAGLGNPIPQRLARHPAKSRLVSLPDDPAHMFETLHSDCFGFSQNLDTVF